MDPATLAPAAIIQTIVVYLIQWLKKSNWFPWLNANSATANRVVAFVVAFLHSAGITWHYSASVGALTINGLIWPMLEQGIWTALAALVTNELVYMAVQIKQQTTPKVP